MSDTSRVTIHRRSADDEKERQLYVSLDGERLGPLRFGRELAREVAAGSHRLRVHNTFWWKTLDFEIAPAADLHFEAVNVVPALMVGLAAVLGTAPMFVRLHPAAESRRPPGVSPSSGAVRS